MDLSGGSELTRPLSTEGWSGILSSPSLSMNQPVASLAGRPRGQGAGSPQPSPWALPGLAGDLRDLALMWAMYVQGRGQRLRGSSRGHARPCLTQNEHRTNEPKVTSCPCRTHPWDNLMRSEHREASAEDSHGGEELPVHCPPGWHRVRLEPLRWG